MTLFVRKAVSADAEAVLALYRSLVGADGCVWDDVYPGADNIADDLSRGALYVGEVCRTDYIDGANNIDGDDDIGCVENIGCTEDNGCGSGDGGYNGCETCITVIAGDADLARGEAVIIAAASAGGDDETGVLDCWSADAGRPCEIARVCVDAHYQHMGVAVRLLERVERDVKARGYDAIRLFASVSNPRAVALYRRLRYEERGMAEMFDAGMYHCFEKKL